MAETSNQTYSTGLVLGVALAFLLAILLFVVVLPQVRDGAGTTIDVDVEQPAPDVPDVPISPELPGRDGTPE